MKWMFAVFVVLGAWMLFSKSNSLVPAESGTTIKPTAVSELLPQNKSALEAAMPDSGFELFHAEMKPDSELIETSSALCLDGRGCILDLHENWHLKLLGKDGHSLNTNINLVFKSRNFKEAAEQLHYSRQKTTDHETEQKLEQRLLAAVQKFQAKPEALGCRDNICLLQLIVPRDIKVDAVRKSLMGPSLSWSNLTVSDQKSKYTWRLRLIGYVNENAQDTATLAECTQDKSPC